MENGLELISRIASGDKFAFEELVLLHQQKIYSLCLRMSGNEDDAYDLAQDTFIKAYKSISSFKMESSISTWLYRIASNTCIDFLRRKKKRFKIVIEIDDESEAFSEIPDTSLSPQKLLEKKELREAIAEALLKLSPQHRQIVILRDINELTYTEIAEILELGEGTVKSRLSRAREQLRRALGNIIGGPDV